MDFTFDYKKNLQALSGYRIANPKPLDARTVVNTREDIAEFASVVYPGFCCVSEIHLWKAGKKAYNQNPFV